MLKKGFDDLAEEVERVAPPWGKLAPVFYSFKDETKKQETFHRPLFL